MAAASASLASRGRIFAGELSNSGCAGRAYSPGKINPFNLVNRTDSTRLPMPKFGVVGEPSTGGTRRSVMRSGIPDRDTLLSSSCSLSDSSRVKRWRDSGVHARVSKTPVLQRFVLCSDAENSGRFPAPYVHRTPKKKFVVKSDEFEIEEIDEMDGMDMSGYERDDDDDDEEEEDAMDRELDKESDMEEELNMRDVQKSIKSEFESALYGEEGTSTAFSGIDESKFHKLKLHACDFYIRKVEDGAENNVYDFQEMYASAPDGDIFSVPIVKSEMPKEPVRCNYSEWKLLNTKLPPIEGNSRKPYAVEANEVHKVFLIKHYKNIPSGDPKFFLDFEEIYVIDGAEKSILRADVKIEVGENGQRDRHSEVLIVRDNGTTFRLIPQEKQKTPDQVILEKQWETSRKTVDGYLRTFRDYDKSNWF